ncbi:hypothetical protein [Streptomyces sp. Caat 7-52]|uniref:hypothetical protein n=1 Tax=Streptomyces sp. Caat 7-52 TaxID=2949637 RepID=UPI00203633CC|nr:hypothetical protein [Streptomyces sp. Caat 7-52]
MIPNERRWPSGATRFRDTMPPAHRDSAQVLRSGRDLAVDITRDDHRLGTPCPAVPAATARHGPGAAYVMTDKAAV